MKNDRDTGRPLGLGFVAFARHEDAKRAIAETNGYELDGRWLRVEWSQDARKAQGKGSSCFAGKPASALTKGKTLAKFLT